MNTPKAKTSSTLSSVIRVRVNLRIFPSYESFGSRYNLTSLSLSLTRTCFVIYIFPSADKRGKFSSSPRNKRKGVGEESGSCARATIAETFPAGRSYGPKGLQFPSSRERQRHLFQLRERDSYRERITELRAGRGELLFSRFRSRWAG